MVKANEFRADLLARLQVFTFTIPPLRERPEDLLLIMELELSLAAKSFGRKPLTLTSEAKAALVTMKWPDNACSVHALANQLTAYTPGDSVTPEDIMLQCSQPELKPENYRSAKANWERNWFDRLLTATGGNRLRAAQITDIDPKTLYTKLRELGLVDSSPD